MHALISRLSVLLLACAGLILSLALPSPGDAPTRGSATGRLVDVSKRVEAEADSLETLYKHLHSNPELSLAEFRTAAGLADELKTLASR
jgi:hypothetical protein